MLRQTPYLRKIREANMVSLRKLAAVSGVDRRTIADLEAGRREARPETIEKLAAALGAPAEDLVGRAGMSSEQMHAFLDSVLAQKNTYGSGDPLYDDDPFIGMSDAELAWLVRSDPDVREVAQLKRRMRWAIEHADEERQRLEAEGQPDAS